MTIGAPTTTDRPTYLPTAARHATLDAYDAPIVDLFAGPGGWDEGAAIIGVTNTYGLEFEANACATAEAAGHARMLGDLSSVEPTDYRPAVGLIASPPCQAWTKAGKQLARFDKAACFDLVDAYARGDSRDVVSHQWEDPRSHLVAEPMRWAVALEPDWIVLEEVTAVLGLWTRYAEHLERRGYSVWHGILNAADYGVPQTRKRAILIASRLRTVGRPVPTHFAVEGRETPLLGLEKWTTMAEALGWEGAVGFPRRSDGRDEVVIDGTAYRARVLRATDEPAQTVTEKARSWAYMRPATTVVGSFRPDIIAAPGWRKPGDGPRQNAAGSVRVEAWEAGVLQSFRPDYPWTGARTRQYQQIGNAVPPRLAAHVIAEAIGLDRSAVLEDIAHYYEESVRTIAAIRTA